MKFKSSILTILAGLVTVSVIAGGSSPPPSETAAPDKAKLSYAVGTRLGIQLNDVKSRVDTGVAIRAIQDVFDGKSTMLQENELGPILNRSRNAALGMDAAESKTQFSYAGGMRAALSFKHRGFELDSKIVTQAIDDELDGKSKMDESQVVTLFKQAAAYEVVTKSAINKSEGDKFLTTNARVSGINVLPDGLQYQVVKTGDGPLATTNDLIFIKYRGTFINGSEFDHHNHYLTRINGGIQGWKDALPQMKVGSEWKIFVPPSLAYGEEGLASRGVAPNTTVIYDLQLLSIAPPGGTYEISSGLGNGADIDAAGVNPAQGK